jgi:hypothetical protein
MAHSAAGYTSMTGLSQKQIELPGRFELGHRNNKAHGKNSTQMHKMFKDTYLQYTNQVHDRPKTSTN